MTKKKVKIKNKKLKIEEKKESDNSFRIQAKNLFLTYSRAPEEWTKEYLRDKIVTEILVYSRKERRYQTRVRSYVIAEEKHKEPVGEGDYERGDKHYHCLIELKEKVDIRDQNFLDIDGIHGNYQAVNDLKATRNYVKKCGDFIEFGLPNFLKEGDRAILQAATDSDAEMMLMDQMNPKDKLSVRDKMVTLTKRKTVVEEIVAKAPLYAFQQKLLDMDTLWESGINGRPMGVLMTGESESGKTTLAYRIAKKYGEDVLIVRDKREMSQHYKGQKVILFDEVTKERFENMKDFLAMVITDPQAKTEAYYGSRELAWPRKVLIATNEDIKTWKFNEAMRSRVIVVKTFKDNDYEFQKFEGENLQIIEEDEIEKIMDKGKIS